MTIVPASASTEALGVVVVDFNGAAMTERCVASLLRSTVAPCQVIVVDNHSTVPIRPVGDLADARVTIVRTDRNRGFAGGANAGLALLDTRWVALVNNDVVVEPGWDGPLLAALADPEVAAASPLMLLAHRFHHLAIDAPVRRRSRWDRREVSVQVLGIEPLHAPEARSAPQVTSGSFGLEPHRGGWTQWLGPHATVVLPAGVERWRIRLDAPVRTSVSLAAGGHQRTVEVVPGGTTIHLHEADLGPAVDLVNNAGTVRRADGYGLDRGLWEAPEAFAEAEDVEAWCGGAVVLRRGALDGSAGRAPLEGFDERLFLYYEDLDLSLRGRRLGWRYRFCPTSVVRHDHGATAADHAPMAERYKERNRLLLMVRHDPWHTVVWEAARFVLATASYLRRDVLVPVVEGRRPRASIVVNRIRSLAAAMASAPAMWRSRGSFGAR